MAPGSVPGLRVLITGLPRSGTTWLARMLASCEDTELVMEPDNPYMFPYALRKRKLPGGYYTALAPTDEAPDLERMWREAFGQQGGIDTASEALRRRAAKALLRRTDQERVRAAFCSRPRLATTLRAVEIPAVPGRPREARNVIVKSVQAARPGMGDRRVDGASSCSSATCGAAVELVRAGLDRLGAGQRGRGVGPRELGATRVRLDLPPAPTTRSSARPACGPFSTC